MVGGDAYVVDDDVIPRNGRGLMKRIFSFTFDNPSECGPRVVVFQAYTEKDRKIWPLMRMGIPGRTIESGSEVWRKSLTLVFYGLV